MAGTNTFISWLVFLLFLWVPGYFLFIFLKSSWFYSSCIIYLFLLGLIHHVELTVFWSHAPPSSECMTCVTSTLLMICNDNSSKGSCTKWLMHFIIFTVSAGFQLTLWFVVKWVITCVLLHFCTCGWPFSLWLETFISAICSGHGCMTKEETFLEPLKGLWVRINSRFSELLNTVENNMAMLPPRHSCQICNSCFPNLN